MTIIHVYDTTPEDLGHLQTELANVGDLSFTTEPLTVQNVDAEAEVISVFISSPINAELMTKFPKLKLIACRSTGFDQIDLEAAKARGITVVNVPSYGEHTVAEYTFGLLLALTRRIIDASLAFQEGIASHDELRGIDLSGKTLGLIGTGHIGRNVASIAHGFGLNVTAYDSYPDQSWAKLHNVTYADLDILLRASDIVTLHIPYSEVVHHLINKQKLSLMKPTAIIVNTARGELIDTRALVEALDAGKLRGAALDVFEGEVLVDTHNELRTLLKSGKQELLEQGLELDVLRKLPNVIVTNHNAFNTTEAIARINQISADNIKSFLAGTTKNNVIKQ